MEDFPSSPLALMHPPKKPQEQQVRGEKHLSKHGLKVPKQNASVALISTVLHQMLLMFILAKKTPKPKQNLTQNGRWETHSVSYHSDLTLQYPSRLSHPHWNICLVKQAGKCLRLEQ